MPEFNTGLAAGELSKHPSVIDSASNLDRTQGTFAVKTESPLTRAPSKILNKHTSAIPPEAQYIGRGSPYGNPFVIGQHGDRDMVCDLYDRALAQDERRLVALDNLRGKDLVCFCSPKRCHGDTLAMLAAIPLDQRLDWARRVLSRPSPVAPHTGSLFDDEPEPALMNPGGRKRHAP